jgi:hypothetical protein
MRQRDPLSPAEERELDALERALAGEPVEPDLREFAELVEDVRATAPQMTPGFAARLEQRVAEGFPESGEQPARSRPRLRRLLLPAAGSLAAVLVAVVVVVNRQPDDAQVASRAPQTTAAQPGSARESSPALSAPAPSASIAQDSAGAGASSKVQPAPAPVAGTSRGPRKVQRSADLVLRVSNRAVQSAADGVIRTVDRFGGIVASSSSASQGSHAEATFDLRIPTDRLDDALGALSKLGHVVERHQQLDDITGSFESAQDRLSDARAERRGLLKALGRASTQRQIASLRARLRTVRSQIARLNGDLDALRRRADLATVSVTVRGTAKPGAGAGAGADDGGWSPGDAARDALRVLEVIAGVALVALAVLAPLALLAAIVALGVRAGRRRRREGALDPA